MEKFCFRRLDEDAETENDGAFFRDRMSKADGCEQKRGEELAHE